MRRSRITPIAMRPMPDFGFLLLGLVLGLAMVFIAPFSGSEAQELNGAPTLGQQTDGGNQAPGTGSPRIIKVYPEDGVSGVSRNTLIYARFDREMKSSYFNIFTVQLRDGLGRDIPGRIKYVAEKSTVYLIPAETLSDGTDFTVTVKGQVEDAAGRPMSADFSWGFRVGRPAVETANSVSLDDQPGEAARKETSFASLDEIKPEPYIEDGEMSKRIQIRRKGRIEEMRSRMIDDLRTKVSEGEKQNSEKVLAKSEDLSSGTETTTSRDVEDLTMGRLVEAGITNSAEVTNSTDSLKSFDSGSSGVASAPSETKKNFIARLREFERYTGSRGEKAASRSVESDDILNIRIFNSLGFLESEKDVAVYSDGYITFPMVGSIKASGLSTDELIKTITAILERDYYHNPRVEIRFKGVAKEKEVINVYLLGQLKNPGFKNIPRGSRILAALIGAGGTTLDAELEEVKVIRGDREIEINLSDLIYGGETDFDIELFEGDTVFIPVREKKKQLIYVLGNVKYPSRFPFEDGMTVVDALSLSEAMSSEDNNINEIQVIREEDGTQKTYEIDMSAIMRKGEISRDIALRPGDIVYVSKVSRMSRDEHIYILSGQLTHGFQAFQGRFPFSEGMTILDAIAFIKGIPDSLKWVYILRKGQKPVFVDLRAIINNGNLDKDVDLQRGDVIILTPIRYRNIVSRFGEFLKRSVIPSLSTLQGFWGIRKFQ